MATLQVNITCAQTIETMKRNYQLSDSGKYVAVQSIADLLQSILSGNQSQPSVEVVLPGDAAKAAGTFTMASVAATNTFAINGVTFTAVDLRQQTSVVTVADSSGSLNNTYFLLSSPTVNYYVWFNVNSAGTDPALSGKTGIQVNLATNATNAQVGDAIASAVDGLAAFIAANVGHTVTITNAVIGLCTNAANGGVTPGFTITTPREGATTLANNTFSMSGDDTATAASAASAINASTTDLVKLSVTGSSNLAVTTVTAIEPGVGGNDITIVGGANITASGARLTGGAEDASSKTYTF